MPREGEFARLVVRTLLRLYPRSFRKGWGDEMVELFAWRLRRARKREGIRGQLRAWLSLTGDLVQGGILERMGRRADIFAGWRTERDDNEESGGETGMGGLVRDLMDASRRMVRAPLFSLTVVAIVALGIGANTAVFTIFNALLFRPLPFPEADRLVHVYQDSDDGEPSASSFPAYLDMAATDGVFDGVAADLTWTATWEVDGEPRPTLVEFVSASYLPVLGLAPSMGRWFRAPEDRLGAGAYAVVSHRTWVTALGRDPDVLGTTVRINGQPVTIVGVGPEGFHGAAGPVVTDFWMSLSSVGVGNPFLIQNLDRRQDHWYDVLARLAPGVTQAQAQAAMDRLATSLAEEFPELNLGRDITVFGFDEVRYHPSIDGELYPAAGVLMAVVALVLLLACSNLANLLLVRGMGRMPEVAIRRALGASKAHVVRLFLWEALLLSALGGVAGVFLARWLVGFVPALPLPISAPSGIDLAMDVRVFVFTGILVLVTGAVFGIVPALRSGGFDVAEAMKEGSRSTSPGRGISIFRGALVTIQVAVSLVLLVGAGLSVRSLANLRTVDPGVDADRIAYLRTSFTQAGIDPTEGALLFEEFRERVSGLPGVSATAVTSRLPVQGGSSSTTVVEGYVPPTGTGAVEMPIQVVSEDYFSTMGIPLLRGRLFSAGDRAESETVVLLNRTAAERFWPGQDPVGRRIRPQAAPDGWFRVVGVVEDAALEALDRPVIPMYYFHLPQRGLGSPYLVVRTEGDPASLLSSLRRELGSVSSALPPTSMGTLESHLGEAMTMPRVAALLMGAFSLLAILLASMGIYGVVAFTVARRASEIGIRVALGAGRARVVSMVVREVLVAVALGLVTGLGLAVLAAPALEGALYQVPALDVRSFGAGALLLVAVAALASWLPARHAAHADPVEALRME